MEELKRFRDQNAMNTIENDASSKPDNSVWSHSISGTFWFDLILWNLMKLFSWKWYFIGYGDSKRLNTSQPNSSKRKISPPNFKPDIVKVR